MNRCFLVGCTAAALAMGAGDANAQAKCEIKIGGDAFVEASFVNKDLESGLRSTEFRNRFRVHITPVAKADNGLEYGGRIRAAGADTGVNADRAFIFAQGRFGEVRLGVSNSFTDLVEVGANYDGNVFGFDVKASADYFWSTSSDSTVAADSFRDLNAWRLGAQFDYAGFAVGGSYTSFGKSG
ncbi:porin [Azospirillum brasilense]|uniref:porin n=1 Tax=Azospirillum brasilense TaxID=192 RepID=UPI0032B71942